MQIKTTSELKDLIEKYKVDMARDGHENVTDDFIIEVLLDLYDIRPLLKSLI
ncbi:hypothetical protein D3C71_234800 [compost metagenome]